MIEEYVSKCCGAEAIPIITYYYANTLDMTSHIIHDPQCGCTKCRMYCEVIPKPDEKKKLPMTDNILIYMYSMISDIPYKIKQTISDIRYYTINNLKTIYKRLSINIYYTYISIYIRRNIYNKYKNNIIYKYIY